MLTHPGFYTTPLPSDRAAFHIVSVGESEMHPSPLRFRRDQGWHSHQLMLTIEGGGIGDDAGTDVASALHDVLLMPKSRSHGYQVAPGQALWRYLWVEFDGACAVPLLSMLGLHNRPMVRGCAAALEPIERIFAYFHTRRDAALHEASTLLLHTLALIARSARAPVSQPARSTTLDAVKTYMVDHLSEEVTLADLATVAQLSPFHLNRRFREASGVPPMRYLRQIRANRAKALLHRLDLKFSEIGRAVGYPVPQHFSRMFKLESGMTPRRFVAEIVRGGAARTAGDDAFTSAGSDDPVQPS